MKVLVTGGAGFIGSQITEALCRKGASVVVLDNLSTGDVKNLGWKRPGDSLEFMQGDIADPVILRQAMAGCEWVFHEAAVASVPASVDQPFQTHQANLTASLDLYCAARESGVRRVMFASSSAIYGDSEELPKRETLAPACLSPYALQKYAAENYGQMFYKLYGLETVSLRYFNVFGPRQSFNSAYSGVIARFCTTMLKGGAPTVFGDGLQTRDFVYVENVVQANLLAAERPADQVAGRYFNIGCGERISLLDLIDGINEATGQNLVAQHKPARSGDVRDSVADISEARTRLAYEPKVTWREGLKHTLAFYQE